MKIQVSDKDLDKFIELNSHMHSILKRIDSCRKEMDLLEQLYDLNRNEMINLLGKIRETNLTM